MSSNIGDLPLHWPKSVRWISIFNPNIFRYIWQMPENVWRHIASSHSFNLTFNGWFQQEILHYPLALFSVQASCWYSIWSFTQKLIKKCWQIQLSDHWISINNKLSSNPQESIIAVWRTQGHELILVILDGKLWLCKCNDFALSVTLWIVN